MKDTSVRSIIIKSIVGASIITCAVFGLIHIVDMIKYNNTNQTQIVSSNDDMFIDEETNGYIEGQNNTLKSKCDVTKKSEIKVWITDTGTKYHSRNDCGSTNKESSKLISLEKAKLKYSPCKKCF